ncbi:Mitochodrial transcription termination factor-related protein [Corchorus olitorius]|uniref:Mitochodrial transcription termination factor-related protein n=1 Tax=Corchorus olitorius TaxID=93759 RepID=A0A1R3FVP5_9ROSI|nr:Mitochodrial transcription termination factor-related protein [Corchorus olitorius]
MLERFPWSFMFNPARMKEIVEEVKAMGIDPSEKKFLRATFVLRSMSKSTLEKKIGIFKQWGWCDQDILEAFRKHPSSMAISEENFVAIMKFLVNKIGLSSHLIAKQPALFGRSLEKRIIPRALFAQELLSLGLIKDFKLSTLFITSEKKFLMMFVHRHHKKAPELLKLYGEKVKYSRKMISELI